MNKKVQKINYQKELDKVLGSLEGVDEKPRLLIHSCCGPCSSYVLEYLKDYFSISILFYNPNIYPQEEFFYRAKEQEDLIEKMGLDIQVINLGHRPEDFYKLARGKEDLKEGGARCLSCYRLRLEEAALYAKAKGFDYFTTTLSISPHKNSQVLNQIGRDLEDIYGLSYLYSDFKKNEGYKRSVDLTKKYNMYRQDYCGCEFSMARKERQD